MKKLILLLFISFSTLVSSQSRKDKQILKFNLKSKKITKVKGWAQNTSTGKWISNDNAIYNKDCPSYWVSHLNQNFKSIELRTISNGGKKYYALIVEKQSGSYKYPNIKKNWEKEMQKHFFIFSEEEYNNLKDLVVSKKEEDFEIKSKIAGFITDRFKILKGEHLYNEANLEAKVTKLIEEPSYSEKCFRLNYQNVDGLDVIRFRVPETCLLPASVLKKSYFEISLNDFKTLFLE